MSPLQVLAALNVTAGCLARALQRAGERDLARPFARLAWQARTHPEPCEECGASRCPTARRWCKPCALMRKSRSNQIIAQREAADRV